MFFCEGPAVKYFLFEIKKEKFNSSIFLAKAMATGAGNALGIFVFFPCMGRAKSMAPRDA